MDALLLPLMRCILQGGWTNFSTLRLAYFPADSTWIFKLQALLLGPRLEALAPGML